MARASIQSSEGGPWPQSQVSVGVPGAERRMYSGIGIFMSGMYVPLACFSFYSFSFPGPVSVHHNGSFLLFSASLSFWWVTTES